MLGGDRPEKAEKSPVCFTQNQAQHKPVRPWYPGACHSEASFHTNSLTPLPKTGGDGAKNLKKQKKHHLGSVNVQTPETCKGEVRCKETSLWV